MILPLKLVLIFTKPILGGREFSDQKLHLAQVRLLRPDGGWANEESILSLQISLLYLTHVTFVTKNLGTHWLLQISTKLSRLLSIVQWPDISS